MTISNLNSICASGSFPNTFVYHICGMPWASTNDVDFYRWINTTTTDADRDALRAKLFGDSSANVQVLLNLGSETDNKLGAQTVNYDESKGLTVGTWSVSISGDNTGFNWNNQSTMEQFGIIGLDWQPVEDTLGACFTTILLDITPDLDDENKCSVAWNKLKNNGLKEWLDSNWGTTSYDNDIFIYSDSSCLIPIVEPITSGDRYLVQCKAGQLNAPNEIVLALKNRQNIYATNYPQGIEGLTANLFSVHYKDDTLLSGTTPYLMRTGKVKNNAVQDSSGNWKLSMGGFTDQLKFKNTIGQFKGSLKGYFFNKKDNTGDWSNNSYAMPFLTASENYTDSSGNPVTKSAFLPLATDYKEFDNVIAIKDYMVDLLNANATLEMIYRRQGDDIVFDNGSVTAGYTTRFVYIGGVSPYVSGVGYAIFASQYSTYLDCMTDPINNNFCRYFGEDESDDALSHGFVFLRSYDSDLPVHMGYQDGTEFIHIRTTQLDYFIQTDLTDAQRTFPDSWYFENQRTYPVPDDTAGDQYLTIETDGDSEIEVQVGMTLQLGELDKSGNGVSVFGEVATAPTTNKVTFTGNTITGLPMALYNNSSLVDKINSSDTYRSSLTDYNNQSSSTIDDIVSRFNGDLFAVTDVQHIVVNSAIDVFKGILGDPSTDIGLNKGAYKTDIKNVFDRGESNFRPCIDWDSFVTLLTEKQIEGVRYTYQPDEDGAVDTLKLLTNLCLTYKMQMIWEYSPTHKNWWLTFDSFGSGNIATATINARTIEETDIAANELTAIVGGGWYYNKMQANYKTDSGAKVALNYQMTDGRVGHTLKDKILTIDDKLTLLPIPSESAQEQILTDFATMLRLFSQVVYKQKLALNLVKTALIGVGRWSTAEWPPIQNRQTGKRNDGKLIGQVQSEVINLSTGLITVDLLSYPSNRVGISPTLYADTVAKSSNTVTISGLSTDPANNDFADTNGLLTDLAMFGCIDSVSGELKDRDCSCTGYRVTIFERKPDDNELFFDVANVLATQNVFRGTMTKLEVSTLSSTVDIVLDGNGTAFDITKDWVVTFADRADASLQPCQIELYGWLGDTANEVTTSGSTKLKPITVGL